MWKNITQITLVLAMTISFASPASASSRIKDLTDVEGVRDKPAGRLWFGCWPRRFRRQPKKLALHPPKPHRHVGTARREYSW